MIGRILLTVVLHGCFSIAAVAASPIEGVWLTGNGDGLIEIELTNDGPVGTIRGSADKQSTRADSDELNPDPALRGRPLLGLAILQGFKEAGDGRWKGGRIYDPDSGKTYKCRLNLVDENTLEVRGYIGVSLIGRTETWRRYEEKSD